jgi:hypothetical protein
MRRWPVVIGGIIVAVVAAAFAVGAIGDDQSADAPPGLDPDMVQVLHRQGWQVVPDEQATRRESETAARLADRYGPSTHSPHAQVAGVSLANVSISGGGGTDEQLMWVIYVKNVTSDCYGPPGSCDGPPGEGTGAILVDPNRLTLERSKVF